MSRSVDIIIPDSGPIISLAHADRLDLIDVFTRPVQVMDVVKLECLRKPESPDHQRLQDWFQRKDNSVEIVTTPLIDAYQKALEQERSGSNPKATRGLGDATLAWALQNIENFARVDATPLVLVEDRTLSASLARLNKAHVLSTRSWLAALEEAGHIASAREVIAEINQHGRSLSSLSIDKPVSRDETDSSWMDVLHDFRERGGRDGR